MSSKQKKTKKTKTSHPKKPMSMDDLLKITSKKAVGYTRGDRVEGVLVEKTSSYLIIDIGGKSEGLVAESAFNESKEYAKTLKVGDKVESFVIVSETPDGYTILSLRNSAKDFFWKKLEKAHKESTEIQVLGKNVNPAGLVVEISNLNGFVPISHLGKVALKSLNSLVGKMLKVKIIELDKRSNRIILSEKLVSEKEEVEDLEKAFNKVKIGDMYKGVVTTVSDFGCFVSIQVPLTSKKKVSIEGLVHISELSWEGVGKTSEVVSERDEVKIKVIEKRRGKLSFSLKQAQKDPWDDIEKKYKKEEKVKGKITKISDFGIFVHLEPGVEGLIHITKIPPGKKYGKGDDVNVLIEDINKEEKRISLGLILAEKPIGYK